MQYDCWSEAELIHVEIFCQNLWILPHACLQKPQQQHVFSGSLCVCFYQGRRLMTGVTWCLIHTLLDDTKMYYITRKAGLSQNGSTTYGTTSAISSLRQGFHIQEWNAVESCMWTREYFYFHKILNCKLNSIIVIWIVFSSKVTDTRRFIPREPDQKHPGIHMQTDWNIQYTLSGQDWTLYMHTVTHCNVQWDLQAVSLRFGQSEWLI